MIAIIILIKDINGNVMILMMIINAEKAKKIMTTNDSYSHPFSTSTHSISAIKNHHLFPA